MDELRGKLFYEQKNGYDRIDTPERLACEDYCAAYMRYLDVSRTEREAVANAIAEAEERGFVPNVVFPCAALSDPDTGRIAIYYGAADTYVGLAFTTVDEVVDYIKANSSVSQGDSEEGRR